MSRSSLGPAGVFMPSPTLSGQRRHLGPQPADDDRGRRPGPEEAADTTHRTGPHRPQRASGSFEDSSRRTGSRPTSCPSATSCSTAYGVSHPPPAPSPRSRPPPLTSCRVAAITASVPGSRLATLSTMGPTAMPGTPRAATAVSVVRALEHIGLAVDRAGQMVIEPQPVESAVLGGQGALEDVGPPRAEGIEQHVHLHRGHATATPPRPSPNRSEDGRFLHASW